MGHSILGCVPGSALTTVNGIAGCQRGLPFALTRGIEPPSVPSPRLAVATLSTRFEKLDRFDRMSAPPLTAPASAGTRVSATAGDTSCCYHCGLPNPARSPWRAPVNGRERAFCCAGCLAVAQTIHGAGLDSFYSVRTAAAARPDAAAGDNEWVRHDDAVAAAGLVRRLPDGREEASLLLENLTCGACVWLIESWVGRRPGVIEVAVNYATRRARVVWRGGETRLADVVRAIASIGYRAHPYDPDRREALARDERRTLLLRMAVALLGMMQVMMLAVPTYVSSDGVERLHQRLLDWASLTLTFPVVFYSAAPFFGSAWRDLRSWRLGMDVPVALGLAAAFVASSMATLTGSGPVYYDSVTMFVALLLVARYVETAARQRAADAIEAVARQRPATAERLRADGSLETVASSSLHCGDHVVVRPGATIPADGRVSEGISHVEEAILTGESWPRAKRAGDLVLEGAVNRESALVVQVTAAGDATRLAAVLRLVEHAAGERPRMARLADRVAGWFVVGLLVLAAVTAVAWWHIDAGRALAVTFALLVVSCPCALSLATPAALAAAAGALGRRQVVLARADAMEALSRVTHVALDKTGTLTEGRVRLITTTVLDGAASTEAIAIAKALESHSEHPIARALLAEGDGEILRASDVVATPGQGLEGVIDGRRYRIGRPLFAAALAGFTPAVPSSFAATATVVGLASEGCWHAWFAFGDTAREGARDLIARLRAEGITPIVLSGDRAESVTALARELGIDDARAGLAPADKRSAIVELQGQGAVVAMVGDGVNDAPGLAQAQVSISLGSATPLAQWTADVVVLSNDIRRVGEAIATARAALAVVRQNLIWAAIYNTLAIPAAAFGWITPLAAAAGMSASSLVVVLNAIRLLRVQPETHSARPVEDVN